MIFLHGFPKNKRANVTDREQAALKLVAAAFIDATEDQVEALIEGGKLFELECRT